MQQIRTRGVAFAVGALAFVAAHAIVVAKWPVWFGGMHEPWFLNSGRAVAFTAALFFAVGVTGGLLDLSGLLIAAGAFVAMMAVYLSTNPKPRLSATCLPGWSTRV